MTRRGNDLGFYSADGDRDVLRPKAVALDVPGNRTGITVGDAY